MAALPTLRQLEYAVAVAEHKSFQRAARACHVSQPGLSAQIQQLEALLDARLFERDRRNVWVTAAGEELVRRARAVLEEVRGMVETAHGFTQPLRGLLRLGVIPTIAAYLLPQVLPRVRRRHPELRLQLHEGRTAELVAMLRRGELDLLLVALEAPLDGLATLPLFKDRFVVALSAKHRLALRRCLREGDLVGDTVLLLTEGHCLREQALAACQARGADGIGDFRASSLATLVEMVSGGEGVTLLPELTVAVEARRRDLALVPFEPPAPFRTVGLAWRTASGRAAEFALLAESLSPPARRTRPRPRGLRAKPHR
jgi:LysR family hydrogen peroxide-inducible transcriptional activator